jgi:GGDEF domain-containing protein
VAPGDPSSAGGAGPGRIGLVSPRTGLVWAEHLDPRLDAELERASTSDQDLAFARIRIDGPHDSHLPLVYVEIAKLIRESFPLPDCIFETGNDSYSLLLPEMDIDGAVKSLDDLRIKVAKQPIAGRKRPVSIGVSSRGGRLIDGPVLVEEVDISVAKASREGGNQVVGFRADPARFREALSASRQ